MPIYDYECKKCGKEVELFRKIENRANGEVCCGEPMSMVLSSCAVVADNTCYKSMATGQMITSRTQHKNHLKQHGLIEVGNEKVAPPKEFTRTKQEKVALRTEIAARLDSQPR